MTADSLLNLEQTDEEALLQNSLRLLLANRRAQEQARQFWADDADYDRPLWRELASLGFAGMAAPEAYGGTAATMGQLALACAELGRACAAVPFEVHGVALRLLGNASNAADFSDILQRAASGDAVIALCDPTPAVPDGTPSRPDTTNGRLHGALSLIPEAAVADALLVACSNDHLNLVAGGFGRERVATLGMSRRANVVFADVPARAIDVGDHAAALERAVDEAALLFAARQAGMGDWILRQTTEYAASRVQFGRPIGSFQAIQHKLAELFIAQTAGRHLVRYAARRIDETGAAPLAVSRAKSFMAAAMWRATTEAHQIHAGVGFILEHPLHLYFSASRGAEAAFGDGRYHNRRAGRLVLAGGAHKANSLLGV